MKAGERGKGKEESKTVVVCLLSFNFNLSPFTFFLSSEIQ
jgi:hypothetical protein